MAKARTPARATRSRSRRADAPVVAEVEVVEEEKGLGMADGIAIVTAILLVVAILMVDYKMGSAYGGGVFF